MDVDLIPTPDAPEPDYSGRQLGDYRQKFGVIIKAVK